jgi:hypothetical protein
MRFSVHTGKDDVHQTLIRGLATAGPLSVSSLSSPSFGHEAVMRLQDRISPPPRTPKGCSGALRPRHWLQIAVQQQFLRSDPHRFDLSRYSTGTRASACYKSCNGPIDLRVKQREFILLVGGVAVNWPLAAERNKPSRCDRLCIARGIPTAAGNHRGRHYLTTRPCLDRRAVGSHRRPGAILVFVGRGWGQQRRSSACAITAYTMLSHGLPRLVTN